jgi:hypothetical protein
MKLIRYVLSWSLLITGAKPEKPEAWQWRVVRAVIRPLVYARGYIDGQLWRRFGITVFELPPGKRLLGRRE